jgi:hypothetical protein
LCAVTCGVSDVSIDVLIARADAVLYRAKANGRNRVDETMVSSGAERQFDCRAQLKLSAMTAPK